MIIVHRSGSPLSSSSSSLRSPTPPFDVYFEAVRGAEEEEKKIQNKNRKISFGIFVNYHTPSNLEFINSGGVEECGLNIVLYLLLCRERNCQMMMMMSAGIPSVGDAFQAKLKRSHVSVQLLLLQLLHNIE